MKSGNRKSEILTPRAASDLSVSEPLGEGCEMHLPSLEGKKMEAKR